MPFAEGTPTATVRLGGKSYELGFTLGAMKRAKELGVLTLDTSDQSAMMLALPEYVWSCLTEEDRKGLTVAQINELINPSNVAKVAEAIGELFKASTPAEDPSGNVVPAAATEPTAGKQTSINSGQLESMTLV